MRKNEYGYEPQPKRSFFGSRNFVYVGVDGQKRWARVGKPFKVRPKLYPAMVIATENNRDMIRVFA